MSRSFAAVVVALSLPLLVACSDSGSSGSQSRDVTPSPAVESQPATLTKKFGETFTWDDGVAITMSKPKPFTSGADAMHPNVTGVVLDVTVENGSGQPVTIQGDLTMLPKSGGQDTMAIQDKAAGVDLPEDPVAAGGSVKFKVAFSPGDDLTVEVRYGKVGIYEE